MLVMLIASIGAATIGSTASGARIAQNSSLVTNPIAPRGGVAMLPLLIEPGASIRPRDYRLRDRAGRQLDTSLVWVQWGGDGIAQHWSSDSRGLRVRAFQNGDTPDDSRRLFLIVNVPADGEGELFLADQRLQPRWVDVPARRGGDRGGQLVMTESPARPDPHSPFEYWRWVLLADVLAVEPPELHSMQVVERQVAQHFADLWHIGLDRLAEHDSDLAVRLRNLLTRICMDEQQAFAAWPADGAAVNSLLSLLLDTSQPVASVLSEAQAWLDLHERPFWWLESSSAETVSLSIVNPSSKNALVQFSWMDGILDERSPSIPIAVELPEGRLTRVKLDRPRISDAGAVQTLRVRTGGHVEELQVGPVSIRVEPPGHMLPLLRPALTLAAAQSGAVAAVPPDRATLAQIRRREGRWEVFVECLRPVQASIKSTDDASEPQEAVVLAVGSDRRSEASVQLHVPEAGWYDLSAGENDGTLQIHRVSYADRWYCRIVLPDLWLNTLFEGEITQIGIKRRHHDSALVQFGPHEAPPWRQVPGTMSFDLTTWHDLPADSSP